MIQVNRNSAQVHRLQPIGPVVGHVIDTSPPLSARGLQLRWRIDPITGRPIMQWAMTLIVRSSVARP